MASDEAIHLTLALLTFLSASLMLCTAPPQTTGWLYSLQLIICCSFILLVITLVIFSSLQLHWLPAEGAVVTAIEILIYLSLSLPPMFEFIVLWQILYPLDHFHRLTRLPVILSLILKMALAFSLLSNHIKRSTVFKVFLLISLSDYILLLSGVISVCLKCAMKKTILALISTQVLSSVFILIHAFVLLILGWRRAYNPGLRIMLVIFLAFMSTCAARFTVIRYFRGSLRSRVDELELSRQEGCELPENRLVRRPQTNQKTGHEGLGLSEPGTVSEDSPELSAEVDKVDAHASSRAICQCI